MDPFNQAQMQAGLWWMTTESWLLSHGLRIVAALALGYLALRATRRLLNAVAGLVSVRVGETNLALEQRTRTIATLLQSTSRIVILFVVILTVLRETGFDLTPILASAGVAGLAIGFGAQSLVKDGISGFFILLEGQFHVGDLVQIGGVTGVVEQVTLRTTCLRDQEGVLHIIPNGSILVVAVHSGGWSQAAVLVEVAHHQDLNQAFAVLQQVNEALAEELGPVVVEAPQILGVENLSDRGIAIKLAARVQALKQADVARLWRKRIMEAFSAQRIALPAPPTAR